MYRKRIVIIDRELCKPKRCGYQCINVCPKNRAGEECVTVDETTKFPIVDENLCIGCGICTHRCEKLFKAITVINLPVELEQPIHRYGLNKFALYKLPIPKSNLVVGLIGQNGIGKSTVIEILSGGIKPNCGIFDKEIGWKEIIEKFKGTELQNYLKSLSLEKIRVAYKPQNVDFIPKRWKGKVKDLLGRIDKSYLDVVSRLNIKEMLEKEIENLSGGELQLLAIAACLLKDCDLYFFDEPSSYLDIHERLIIAKEIRELVKKAMVMVVEHDLAIADYLADQVHLLYGKPACYGIVSKPYGVRVGINTYLEGYIREENVRFRNEVITFSKRAYVSEKNKLFLNFPSFEKSFDNFYLKTECGEVYKGEIIGILGRNATGKTTFINMLAGTIKPDKGKSIENLKLSYKPQRLVLTDKAKNASVKEFLSEKLKISDSEFKRIMRVLGIEGLFERNVENLSYGELQTLFIAEAFGKDYDILLLDEPSAFLDVEQRLEITKIIREEIKNKEAACFIVDHDLKIIDGVADRVMIFEGVPGVKGYGNKPCSLHNGMNRFLKSIGITFRRDMQSGRARANKPDSVLDREQKEKGEYYYAT